MGKKKQKRGNNLASDFTIYSKSNNLQKRAILLNILSNYFTISEIAKKLEISKRTVSNLFYKYKKDGLINKDRSITFKGRNVVSAYEGVSTVGRLLHNSPLKENDIRLHAFKVRIPIINSKYKWKKSTESRFIYVKEKIVDVERVRVGFYEVPRIIIDSCKIHLNRNSVIISLPNFFEKEPIDAFEKAMEHLVKLARKLESRFGITLFYGKTLQYRVISNHFALIKNKIAKQYNKEKKRLIIRDNKEIWLIIDNSLHLNELELQSRVKGLDDATRMKGFLNDVRHTTHTFSSLDQSILSLKKDYYQGMKLQHETNLQLTKQIKSHLLVVNEMKDQSKEMKELIKHLKKYFKK